MAERKLRIKNYRNIGAQSEEELLINTSLSKGELGSLVIVVGPNNSGKSNCLNALIAFGKEKGLTKQDIPDFDNDNPTPELSIVLCDDQITLGQNKSIAKDGTELIKYFYNDKENGIAINEVGNNKTPNPETLKLAIQIVSLTVNNGQMGRIPQTYHTWAQENVNRSRYTGDHSLALICHEANKSVWGVDYLRNNLGRQISDKQAQDQLRELEIKPVTPPQEILQWEEKSGFKIVPKIFMFTETVTSHNQLTITPDQLKTSPFFKILFSALNYDIDALVNCYQKAREQTMYGILKKTAKEINEKLDEITKQFNKLFYQNSHKYTFELTLEKDAIYLSLSINDTVLHLDKQSSGFRWFFNFYFSIIAQSTLSRGDIIVMDEPATNLHMQGIQELRAFMKEYAKRSELTFVVSTHIPFFVDVDHLEEVRIVTRNGSGATIENKFHAIGDNETDALKPIKDALTVGRYVLYDQSNIHTIFVEGITDYCYLTAFKHLNKEKSIVFLPIQGIKKVGIIETLIKIERYPTILVDGDYEGIEFKKKNANKKNVEIIALSDIDPNWKTIEDLFSTEDKQKTKYFNNAVAFKNRLSTSKVSKETKDNFKKLFDNILV